VSPALSLYLDVLRLFAALLVFAHHASFERFDGEWIGLLAGQGHHAVVVFFVLSGFVVSYAAETKDHTLSAYCASRLSRLWSVALPAIALTLVMDAIGRPLAPELYRIERGGVWQALPSVLFVNEIWCASIRVGTNLPYWSLSYEAAYYVLFALYTYRPQHRALLLLTCLAAGPKILLLAPAWVAGVVAYRWAKEANSGGGGRDAALALGGLVVALFLAGGRVGNLYVTWRVHEWVGADVVACLSRSTAFITDNLIGGALGVHLVGVARLLRGRTVLLRVKTAISRVAEPTFAIYLVHYPSLYFFSALSLEFAGRVHGWAVSVAALLVCLAVTPPTDRLKRYMRRWMLDRWGGGTAQRE